MKMSEDPELYPESEEDKRKRSLVGQGVRPPCCYNCDYMGYTPGQHDQPHPELWCKKEVWHGVEDKETLLIETDCKLHKRAH